MVMSDFETLEALKWLKQNPPKIDCLGICNNVHRLTGYDESFCRWLESVSKRWCNFSGSASFPVPCPNGGSPKDIYHYTGNLWVGEYGALRYELLDFLIETLTKELEEMK
jgi:hypothetical protein